MIILPFLTSPFLGECESERVKRSNVVKLCLFRSRSENAISSERFVRGLVQEILFQPRTP